MEGKWEGIEKSDKPILMMEVPRLKFYIALGRLTDGQLPPLIQMRAQRQAVASLMEDASVLEFWSVL